MIMASCCNPLYMFGYTRLVHTYFVTLLNLVLIIAAKRSQAFWSRYLGMSTHRLFSRWVCRSGNIFTLLLGPCS